MSDYNYYKIGGSLEYQHPTYVVRQADYELYKGLTNGEFCYVLNSRQMGKSSLRVQMMKKLKEQGIKCASIDMTRIGSHVTPSEWYAGIISELLRGFGLARKVNFSIWWRDREILPPLQRLRELIEDVLLTEFTQSLVIFIDEIDSIIKLKFKGDFFAFIRACYNQRVDNPEYNRLTFCLLGVATPSDLIEDKNVSTPFNIGRAIELTGFQLQETASLTQGLEGKISDPQALMSEVLVWTGGQPFLTQKVCKLILSAEEEIPVGDEAAWIENLVRSRLIENWETQDEPEHLRTIRDRILWSQRKEQLLRLYQQILQAGEIKALDKPEYMELRLSGLVVKQQGKLKVYNRIYGSIFNQNWVENVLAEAGLLPEVPETPASSKTGIQALEQAALDALQQFESQQIEALISAIQAGQTLKALVEDGGSRLAPHSTNLMSWLQQAIKVMREDDCPLQNYPTVLPIYALQTILDNIRERNQFNGHRGAVLSVSFSPDGQLIATAGVDGTARLWSLSGKQLTRLNTDQLTVYSVSFSPNRQCFVTGGRDGTARLWDLSGQQLGQLNGHQGAIHSTSFSPDGQLIATTSVDGTVRLWNLSGEQLIQLNDRDTVYSVSFSPSGQRIATAGQDGTVRFWDLSGRILDQWKGIAKGVVSFSPDGQRIVTAGRDGTVQLWSLSGQQLAQLNGNYLDVSFSPDGQYLVTAGEDGKVRLWNVSGGQQVAQLGSHQCAAYSLSFSPNGLYVATTGVDGIARLWDLSEKYLAQLKGHQGSVWTVSFSPNGQLVASAGRDGTARLWNLAGQQLAQLNGHQGSVWSVSFSPDGQYIVTTGSDKTARLWNLTGKHLAKLDGHQGWVIRVIFSPDGQRLATVGRDGTARVWDLSGQLISQVTPQQGWVWSVSFSDDGQLVATVGLDATPPILDLSGRLIVQLKGYQGTVGNVSFSPDGQYLATAGDDGTARLWNLFGQQLAQFDGQQGWVICVSFSPDGQLIATAGEDGSVCLWDLSGRQVSRFNSNQGTIYGISFSPNGQCFATAGQDGIVKLWRVEGLDELLARGCGWLKDYLVTHPEALEKLEVCQNSISSAQEDKNLAGVSEVEDVVSASSSSATVIPDRLSSERGIDYTRLRDLLAARWWKQADRETTALMLRIAGREAEGWLREEDMETFPCTDLLTIDQLWVKYSQGRFGFSLQMKIWRSLGGTKNADYEISCIFCKRLGWKDFSWLYSRDLTFNTTAPVGHLPGSLLDWLWPSYSASQLILLDESADGAALRVWWNIISCLASRLEECNRQSPAPMTVAKQRLVTTVSGDLGKGFLGEFLVYDKLVRIYQGDITNLVTDVIVSSDDTYLRMSGGVSWRIWQVGGNKIYKETRDLIPLSLGDVAVTTAGKLQVKKIFHGVVIDWRNEILPFQNVIRQVVHTCLEKANQYGFQSIAFPLLGTGAGRFSAQAVWEMTLRQIIRDLSTETQSIAEVIVVVYGRKLPEELNVKGFLEKIEESGWRSLL